MDGPLLTVLLSQRPERVFGTWPAIQVALETRRKNRAEPCRAPSQIGHLGRDLPLSGSLVAGKRLCAGGQIEDRGSPDEDIRLRCRIPGKLLGCPVPNGEVCERVFVNLAVPSAIAMPRSIMDAPPWGSTITFRGVKSRCSMP